MKILESVTTLKTRYHLGVRDDCVALCGARTNVPTEFPLQSWGLNPDRLERNPYCKECDEIFAG